MKYTRVAIFGKMKSGKTTFANILCDHIKQRVRNANVEIMKFADPLYNILQYALVQTGQLNFSDRDFNDRESWKDRKFLQYIGTEWGRSIDTDIWVKVMGMRIDENDSKQHYDKKKTCIIIDDLRFENEMQLLRDRGFLIVRMTRYEEDDDDDDITKQHASETSLDEAVPDINFLNNGDMEQMTKSVEEFAEHYIDFNSMTEQKKHNDLLGFVWLLGFFLLLNMVFTQLFF